MREKAQGGAIGLYEDQGGCAEAAESCGSAPEVREAGGEGS
jgi:hypothetical protein